MYKNPAYIRILFCCWLPLFIFNATILDAQTSPTYYYVSPGGDDANPGTESLPWKTLAKAASMATAGVTVFIRQGIYNEQLIPVNSGTADSPITFASFPGDTVTITGAGIYFQLGPVNDKWWYGMIQIQDRSYIKLSGIRVINSDASGIVVIGSNYITIERNYIDSTFSPGIAINTSENIIVEDNEVVRGCMGGDQECISVSATNHFAIKNNRVHDGLTEGIDVKVGSSNGLIARNEVYNQRYRFGIYLDAWNGHEFNMDVFENISHDNVHGFGIASENGGLIERIKIHHNIAYHNDERGFWFAGGGISQTHPFKNIKLYCNTSYENRVGINITAWAGMNIDSLIICNNQIFHNIQGISTNFEPPTGQCELKNIAILNNSIYNNGKSKNGWGDGGINITNNMPQNLLIQNNILSGNTGYTICLQPDVPADGVTIDHNFFDGFRDFLHETAGTNPVYGSPSFVDTLMHNYHLQATSAAIDAGDPDPQYNDPEDPDKPGYALFPAQGTLRNDMGAYGGPFASSWDPASYATIPQSPALVSPFNGATGAPTTLLLGWNGPWGATSYSLEVSTHADFSSLVVETTNLKGSSFGITNLAENTHYYWRVRATNAAGTGSYSTAWSFNTKGPTAIEQPGLGTPVAYGLTQNYPNPFSDATEICFALPERIRALLEVYDLFGRKIETLVDDVLPPGNHKIVFEGRNCGDGIYLCRIQAGNYKEVMRMIILRK